MADIYVASTGSDSTGDGSSGNPYATPGKAGGNHSGGDRIIIENANYSLTSDTANVTGGPLSPVAGTVVSPTLVVGCNSIVGDLDSVNDFTNFPILSANASHPVTPFTIANSNIHVYNLACNGGNQSNRAIWISAGSNSIVCNCKGYNALFFGLEVEGSASIYRCYLTGNGSSGAALYISSSNVTVEDCLITGNSNPGIKVDGVHTHILRCIIHSNTGASTDGIIVFGSLGAAIRNSILYNNGRAGIRLSDSTSPGNASIKNNIIYLNAEFGIYSGSVLLTDPDIDYNAFLSNTSGPRNNVPAGSHDITLTADPFVSKSTGNFALNSTAGGGAALKALGFPVTFPLGLTQNYLDIGVAQSQASAAVAALLGNVGMGGGYPE